MKYLFAMTALCKQTSLKQKREQFVFLRFPEEVSIWGQAYAAREHSTSLIWTAGQ